MRESAACPAERDATPPKLNNVDTSVSFLFKLPQEEHDVGGFPRCQGEGLPSRSVTQEVVSTLAFRSGWILRHGLAAAVLAILCSLILPWTWKSTAVLLPADRRTDEFHYRNAARSGLVRLLESFRLRDRTHPEEIDHAVLTSDETLRRLIERFDLQRRWKSKTQD